MGMQSGRVTDGLLRNEHCVSPQLTVNVPLATWRHKEQLYTNKDKLTTDYDRQIFHTTIVSPSVSQPLTSTMLPFSMAFKRSRSNM